MPTPSTHRYLSLLVCLLWATADCLRADVDTDAGPDDAAVSGVVIESTDQATPLTLVPFVVTAPTYKSALTPLEIASLQYALDLPGLHGWPPMDGSYVITAERVPQATRNAVTSVRVHDGTAQESTAGTASFLAAQLDRVGGTSNPAPRSWMRSGRTERADVPMGATLVLVNGRRACDPFDGSIHASELSQATASRWETVPASGGTAWGAVPAGVVQFFSMPVQGRFDTDYTLPPGADPDYPPPPRQTVHAAGVLETEVGSSAGWRVEFLNTEPGVAGMLQFSGRFAVDDGFDRVVAEDRGAIDEPHWKREHGLEARWRRPLSKTLEFTLAVKEVEETRGLGTPYQRDHSRALTASFELSGAPSLWFAWNAISQISQRSHTRTFSAVDRPRDHEFPLFDEVAEPVLAWSTSWVGAWRHARNGRTNIGADVRGTRGETRGQYDFSVNGYAREIVARGDQWNAGIFILHHRDLGPRVSASLGLRMDALHNGDGRLRESDRRSAATLSTQQVKIGDEVQWSPSVGVVCAPRAGWVLRASMQRSYRPPTLADRFRLTTERDRLIKPNPSLRTAEGTNSEISVERKFSKAWQVSARAFASVYHDAIATRGAGSAPDGTMVPLSAAGLVEWRERVNLDRASASGAEFTLSHQASRDWSWDATLTLQSSSFTDVAYGPAGASRQLPAVPQRAAVAGATWSPGSRFAVRAQLRWLGREFTDEENDRRLGEAILGDLAATLKIGKATRLFLRMENLGNVTVVSDLGLNGTRFRSSPRSASAGVRLSW